MAVANKSYKDYYHEKRVAPSDIAEELDTTTDVVEEPAATKVETKITEDSESVRDDLRILNEKVGNELKKLHEDNTKTASLLSEHTKQFKEMAKSINELTSVIRKMMNESREVNTGLVEATQNLATKINKFEENLDELNENTDELQKILAARRRVLKEVHRDKKGLITHITESEMDDENNTSDI